MCQLFLGRAGQLRGVCGRVKDKEGVCVKDKHPGREGEEEEEEEEGEEEEETKRRAVIKTTIQGSKLIETLRYLQMELTKKMYDKSFVFAAQAWAYLYFLCCFY